MAVSGPESKETTKAIKALRAIDGVWAIKVHQGRFSSGQVDILACVRGTMVQIEMKAPNSEGTKAGEPTPLQAATMRQWADAGATTACCHTVAEVLAVVEPLLA